MTPPKNLTEVSKDVSENFILLSKVLDLQPKLGYVNDSSNDSDNDEEGGDNCIVCMDPAMMMD